MTTVLNSKLEFEFMKIQCLFCHSNTLYDVKYFTLGMVRLLANTNFVKEVTETSSEHLFPIVW